jgi:hypothetical protein
MRKTLIALILIAILAPAALTFGRGVTRLDEWKQWNRYLAEEQERDARLRAIQEQADRMLGIAPSKRTTRPGSQGTQPAAPQY